MQDYTWNDLRYVLALNRAGTIAGAAQLLGVNDTTVLRRIRHLEQALNTTTFHRTGTGEFTPSLAGEVIIRHAEHMEQDAAALSEALGKSKQKLVGTVRITSVPVIVNHILVPAIKPFLHDHPDLVVELTPDARDLNLTQREADLAIRLARPTTGGTKVKARRIGRLLYGVYAPAACVDPNTLGWVTFDDMFAHLPQAQWVGKVTKSGPFHLSGLRVADTETALTAVASGAGLAILPDRIAQSDRRLQRLNLTGLPDLPQRDIWLLSHVQQQALTSVQTVMRWIDGLDWTTP